jgi:hypothetical protein
VPNPRPDSEQLLRRITPANVSFNDQVSSPPHHSGLGMHTVKRSALRLSMIYAKGARMSCFLWTLSKSKAEAHPVFRRDACILDIND